MTKIIRSEPPKPLLKEKGFVYNGIEFGLYRHLSGCLSVNTPINSPEKINKIIELLDKIPEKYARCILCDFPHDSAPTILAYFVGKQLLCCECQLAKERAAKNGKETP